MMLYKGITYTDEELLSEAVRYELSKTCIPTDEQVAHEIEYNVEEV